MTKRGTILRIASGLVALLLATPTFAQAEKSIPVVATFSILGDMVKRIGGTHVAVTTLVGPNGDAHVYQPTPADARAVKSAKVLFVNGLEFEGWIDRLVTASGFGGTRVVATDGIKAILSKRVTIMAMGMATTLLNGPVSSILPQEPTNGRLRRSTGTMQILQ